MLQSSHPAKVRQNSCLFKIHVNKTCCASLARSNLVGQSFSLQRRANNGSQRRSVISTSHERSTEVSSEEAAGPSMKFQGMHHNAFICADLDAAMAFYHGVLGLDVNLDRPDDKLPYSGAWLWIGRDMIHLMVLPNPDPFARPAPSVDRRICVGIEELAPLEKRLSEAGIPFSMHNFDIPGEPTSIIFRDPDANTLEVGELAIWRI
eukprot:CAMPEP_0196573888 /NCGR_PEP_ID=MMETSP1081-20130531/3711_1 /TAXON_ID=36882 /ORGANISM="Pyramimonas amylifera, Strain CCMP720" /LENGTH=205 /DNA_ID=CAMNT_0041891735 /DNA_START=142 /DNA_END=759 /DNA_ORIENTATION=-